MRIYTRNGTLYVDLRAEGLGRTSTGLKDTPYNRRIVESEYADYRPAKDFGYFARMYLRNKEIEVKPSSFQKYARIVSSVCAKFGDMPIGDIKVSNLSKWLDSLDVSPKTERDYHTVLRGIFQEAVYDDEITDNPAKKLRKPKLKKPEIEPFTPSEMERIIATADGWFKNLVMLGFYTGMRTGEIAGLKWDDIDFNAKTIHVRRTRRKGMNGDTKTDGSRRIIPILPSLEPALRNQYGLTGLRNGYVFMKDGKPLPDTLRLNESEWKSTLRRAGVPYRRMYNMRHTFIVTMLNSGHYPVMTIAKWVGHTSPQMIFNCYAKHVKSELINADFDPFGDDFGTLLAQSG
ncbi:tyrosine-type recombinase/integrase [Hydrogenimonas urashimensis]|uniref:tyrosine-type recombinase/integrase n=1 Tax=Hydrogenimonas urashimensis TaxID=2740515 RepID=UPI0019155CBC|nr:site-specific integrase [Hydrogenimonas urashimensis]